MRDAYSYSSDVGDDERLDNDTLDLRSLWFILRRRIGVVLAVASMVLAASVLVTFQMTPSYKAVAKVLIDPSDKEVVDFRSSAGGLLPDAAMVDTEVEVIQSRALAARVADELNLTRDPEFNLFLRERDGAAAMIGSVTDAIGNFMTTLLPTDDTDRRTLTAEEQSEAERDLVITTLLKNLDVQRSGFTHVIDIAAESEDPRKAALIANTFADQYRVDQLEAKLEATRRANEWLLERLNSLRDEVRTAESAVESYRAQAGLLGTGGGATLTEQQIAELNAQLVLLRADLEDKEARLSTLRSIRASGRSGDDFLDVLNSPLILQLSAQKAQVQSDFAQLSERYGRMHPEMLRVTRELADVESEMEQEVRRIFASLENEVQVARQRVSAVTGNVQRLRQELEQNNVSTIRLRELERTAGANRSIYEAFLERSEQTGEQQTLQQADARIISRAAPPMTPSSPNHQLNLALGFVLALLAGGLVMFLAETFDGGMRMEQDVERLLNTRCLATVPKVGGALLAEQSVADVADYMWAKPFSAYAEAIRSVRASVLLSRDRSEVRTVAITSALPNEGKSTLAFSLARMSAMMQSKTVIIDGDLRRRTLTRAASASSERGLMDVLDGSATLEEVMMTDEHTDLTVIPAGRAGDGDANRVVRLGDLGEILEDLRNRFELVVLDTTPVLAVAEARELATWADKVVIATRWRKTPRNSVKAALRVLDSVGAPVAGVVLTQANMRVQALYSGEGAYDKSYGAYYTD